MELGYKNFNTNSAVAVARVRDRDTRSNDLLAERLPPSFKMGRPSIFAVQTVPVFGYMLRFVTLVAIVLLTFHSFCAYR